MECRRQKQNGGDPLLPAPSHIFLQRLALRAWRFALCAWCLALSAWRFALCPLRYALYAWPLKVYSTSDLIRPLSSPPLHQRSIPSRPFSALSRVSFNSRHASFHPGTEGQARSRAVKAGGNPSRIIKKSPRPRTEKPGAVPAQTVDHKVRRPGAPQRFVHERSGVMLSNTVIQGEGGKNSSLKRKKSFPTSSPKKIG